MNRNSAGIIYVSDPTSKIVATTIQSLRSIWENVYEASIQHQKTYFTQAAHEWWFDGPLSPPRYKVNYRSQWEPLNHLTVNMTEMIFEWSSTNFTFLYCPEIEDGHHAWKKFSRTKYLYLRNYNPHLIIINNYWIMSRKNI